MKKSAFVTIFSLVFVSVFGSVCNGQATDDRLTRAYDYILSRYNPALGLVSESEDRGVNAVNGTTVNNTYWIYSDNLWAAEALKPYNATVAANISKTVRSYIKEYGKSMLFEVVLGEIIPTTIHAEKNIVAYNGTVNGSWVQILLDRHQFIDDPEGIFNDADKYADLCFYLTIDYWLMNDIHASEHWFSTGESLWNRSTNNGFYDKAARKEGLYQNMKLGLFLLAQRVTGFPSNITSAVEEAVWSYQRANGGIASLSHLNGTVYGMANVETMSALLLAYNDQSVARLQRRQNPELERIEKLLADLNATYHSLLLNYTELLANYDFLQERYNNLSALHNGLVADFDDLNSTYHGLLFNYTELLGDFDSLQSNYTGLKEDYDALSSLCEGLNATYNEVMSKQQAILFRLSNMRDLMYAFVGATIFFIVTTLYFAKRKTKS
jgi:hypothetical protein